MVTLLGISGSLRKGSLNTALLKAATETKGEGYFRISAFNSRANAEEVGRRIQALKL